MIMGGNTRQGYGLHPLNPDLVLEISLAMAQEKRRFSEPTKENSKSEDQPKIS
jgi:hypothetical protein